MSYKAIDAILDEWADAHGLLILREYKEMSVRSVEDRSERPYRYQIWVDEPDENGMIGIHAWDLRKNGKRRDLAVPRDELRNCLEKVLEAAKSWDLNA